MINHCKIRVNGAIQANQIRKIHANLNFVIRKNYGLKHIAK